MDERQGLIGGLFAPGDSFINEGSGEASARLEVRYNMMENAAASSADSKGWHRRVARVISGKLYGKSCRHEAAVAHQRFISRRCSPRGRAEGDGEKRDTLRLLRARRRRWDGVVGGGKARLESRAWLEAHISVNNSRPTACIFPRDGFSLLASSRMRDKVVGGPFDSFP